ncbi:hypothetical protein LAZ67_22001648 [Cordylochernes scorpioides]|uniref:DDE-1 domain-containing protein n=1 Tax=Cordylochernes scorpioides TaxID=51811 RepID=A0ABY6LP61_9ARAC|nr:hypothetical protein LAZ67_22001648 [Cordylochernes scorpioides]
MRSQKRKRESITIEKKKEICQLARNNPTMSKNEIGKRFSLPRTTVRDILTQAEKWENYTRFKGRFHILQRRLCGEGPSISPAIIDEHLTNLNSILANSGYDPANIYNADETGLFFQLIPDRTLAQKNENCRGVKRMKQRITVLLCCNSTGTDKRRLLIIGKSAKPRCFRNFSPHFYCTYTSNSKAWMTSSIFQEWLLQFNKQLVSEGRRILLLLDNATSHCVPNDGLSNIKIHFLPPNMTASLQPLDSGIIKSFKAQYRKLQLQKMVELADAHLPTELRLDYAVRYCKMAWDSVSPDSISNCWNHTGIIRFTSTAAVEPLNYGNLLNRIRDIFAITPENLMTEREFQLVDDSQEAEMKLTDDNFLVSTVTAKEELGEDDDATVTQHLPSLREARTAAETVLLFLEHSKRATSDDVNLSADLLRRVYAISEGEKTQVVITDFFKKIKIWKQFIETGTIKRKEGSGRKRKTATSEYRYLVVTAKRHREMTAIQLSNELSSATGTRISRQTVYRRLHEGALYARRPMVITLSDLECDYLNAKQCCKKLNWCVLPEIVAHSLLTLLILLCSKWVLLLFLLPMTLYQIYCYRQVPKGNIGTYDPTEIHNRRTLKRHMRESMIRLAFYLIFFFIFLYWIGEDDGPMGLSKSSVRLIILSGFYVLFLILGASIFSAIESPQEVAIIRSLKSKRAQFLQNHPCVSGHLEQRGPHIPELNVLRDWDVRQSSFPTKFTIMADRDRDQSKVKQGPT